MRVLVIVPAYNESENIVWVIENLRRVCPQYDYVVVNDGSSDSTADLCRRHGYRLLSLPVNLGLSGAFQTGMRYAWMYRYDAAIQFDADGQHCAEYIAPMAEKLSEGYDIVIGSRFLTEKKPRTARMAGSRLISWAIRMTTGQKLTDPTSGMRIYSRRMIREFAAQINHPPEPDTVSYLIKRGAKVTEIQVRMNERRAGKSYLSLSRSVGYMVRMGISILLVQPFRGGARPLMPPEEPEKKESAVCR